MFHHHNHNLFNTNTYTHKNNFLNILKTTYWNEKSLTSGFHADIIILEFVFPTEERSDVSHFKYDLI